MNKENISLEYLLNSAVVKNDIHVVKFLKDSGIELSNITKESIIRVLQKENLEMIAFLMEEKTININNFSLSNFDIVEPSKMDLNIVKIMQKNGADITLVPPQVINNLIKEGAFETAYYILKEQEFIKLQKKYNSSCQPIIHIYEEMEKCAKQKEIKQLINLIEITGLAENLSASNEIIEIIQNEDYEALIHFISQYVKKEILNKKICEMVNKNDLEGLTILVSEGAPLAEAFYISIKNNYHSLSMYLLNERADLYINMDHALEIAQLYKNQKMYEFLIRKSL